MRPVIENAVELLWKSFSIQFNEIIQGNAGEGGALKNLKKGLSMRSKEKEKDSSFIVFCKRSIFSLMFYLSTSLP